MRSLIVALMLPMAACASVEPAPMAAAPGSFVTADAGPAAMPEPNSPANATVKIADKAEPKVVCWNEIVTGTRGRKQKVCRTERSERNGELTRDALKDFQNRSGASGPPPIMGGG
jgi:hypothetical protein